LRLNDPFRPILSKKSNFGFDHISRGHRENGAAGRPGAWFFSVWPPQSPGESGNSQKRLLTNRRAISQAVDFGLFNNRPKAVGQPMYRDDPVERDRAALARVGVGPVCASLRAAEAPMPGTRKLTAILASDAFGYPRLAGADEDRMVARLRALRSDLIAPTVDVHKGRVAKRTGDRAS